MGKIYVKGLKIKAKRCLGKKGPNRGRVENIFSQKNKQLKILSFSALLFTTSDVFQVRLFGSQSLHTPEDVAGKRTPSRTCGSRWRSRSSLSTSVSSPPSHLISRYS
jgi:hypothetical protein